MNTDLKLWKTEWKIEKYASEIDFKNGVCFETNTISGNIGLNEGLQLVGDLMIGESGTPYNNTNAYIGVGESTTAAAATDTGLLGSTLTYKGMESGYPSRTDQTITFRSEFGANDANYSWQEFSLSNSDSNSGVNINRKTSNQGLKVIEQIWTLNLTITLS